MDAFKSIASGARFNTKKNLQVFDLFKKQDGNKVDLEKDVFRKSSASEENEVISKGKNSDDKTEEVKDKVALSNKEEEINAFRNRLQIRVKGERIPAPADSFQRMKISPEMKHTILQNVEKSDWKEPTPIQMQSIPILLSQRDILAAAPTGSGKTASYVIPMLSILKNHRANYGIRGMILAPTKELVDQIQREILRLCDGKKFKVCALKKTLLHQAMNSEGQKVLSHYDILVATPLRLITLIRAKAIDLTKLEFVALDEADKLFEVDTLQHKRGKNNQTNDDDDDDDENVAEDENGNPQRIRSSFLTQIDEILAEVPKTTTNTTQAVVRGLFSATLGPLVKELAGMFLTNRPIEVTIGVENAGAGTITQRLVFVGREDGKLLAMRQLIQEGIKPPVLLFLQSIERAKELFQELIYDGINVDIMHANRSATSREEVMRKFRRGDIWVLICTDLMARGIDFQGVQMVINYDLPLTAVSYIHRIGRTGRAGRRGEAVTFFTEQDIPRLRPIANVVKLSGCAVPDWMLAIPRMSTKDKKQLRRSAPKRRSISTTPRPRREESNEDDEDHESNNNNNNHDKKNNKKKNLNHNKNNTKKHKQQQKDSNEDIEEAIDNSDRKPKQKKRKASMDSDSNTMESEPVESEGSGQKNKKKRKSLRE